MKRTTILSLGLVISMMMSSVNANAQRRDRGNERDRHRMEQRDHRRRNDRMRHDDRHAHRRPQGMPYGGRMVRHTPPHVRRGHYVPGWEGRVRHHHDGRWGYCVGGTWVYYEHYYNPYDFFGVPHPPRHHQHAHAHHSPAHEVAAGVATVAAIACIVGALAN